MGLLDEFRKLTHPYSDAEDDYDLEEDPIEEEESPSPSRSYGRTPASTAASTAASSNRVVNISSNPQSQLVVVRPERFAEVTDIADHLRNRKAIVLNLEKTNRDVARRTVDFLSGCTYALDGKIRKAATSIFLIVPYNMDIEGVNVEDLENASS